MKNVIQAILFMMFAAVTAQAQSTCVVTGTLRSYDLSPNPNGSVTIIKVIKAGAIILNGPYTIPANQSGVVSLTVPRASTIYLYADAPNLNKSNGVALAVPDAGTANLEDLVVISQVPVSGLTVYEEASLLPGLYGTLKFIGSSVTAAQQSTGVSTVTINAESPLTFSTPLDRVSNTVSLPVATASQNGYLASVDWTVFNNKENALTFSSPLSRSVNAVSIAQANGSQSGYLSSADWTTFNNKQNALIFGNLTVGPNLSVTGGNGAVIGSGAQIALGPNVVTSVVNDTNIQGSIAANSLTFSWAGTLADNRIASSAIWNAHLTDTNNPHSVTKAQVGLGNVTNDAQLKIASNLSDLASASSARSNLGLGNSAILNVGTSAGTVAAGDHTHTLSQVTDAGTAASKNYPATGNAASGEVVLGSDTRLSDARTPLSHTHTESEITNLVSDLAAKVPTSRTITAGIGLSGGGDLSVNRSLALDLSTLVASQTIFDGSQASRTITFNLSGVTDPIITIGNNSFDISTGVLKQGGTAVSLSGHTHTASDIASGQLGLVRGGTGADLSGTGPGFLKQATTGAGVTVAAIADSDVNTALGYTAANAAALNASNLTSGTVPDARFPSTLPAVSGANLTSLNASNLASGTVPLARLSGITNTEIASGAAIAYSKLSLSGSIVDADVNSSAAIAWTKISKSGSSLADLAARSASDLSSGTLPDGRFPATLPAISGASLTNLNASNLASGTVPLARLAGITNAEISASAAIAWSKIDKTGSSLADLATRSAADLSSGTLADARLSSNVPLKNGANTFTAAQAITPSPNTTPFTISSYSLTGTNTQPLVDLSGTWNIGTTTATAIKLNVTDTASNANSVLMDLQVGGASKFKVDKAGGGTISTLAASGTLGVSNVNGSAIFGVVSGSAQVNVSAPEFVITQTGAPIGTGKLRIAGANFSIGEVPSDGFIDFDIGTSIFRIGVGGRQLKLGDADLQGNGTLLVVDDLNAKIMLSGQPSVVDLDPTGLPGAGAILTINSTDLGFLPPRMTSSQRDSISSPAEGLLVHDTTNHAPAYFDGTVWQTLDGERRLATLVLDVNTTSLQDAFEVPAGKTLVLTKVIVRSASADLSALAAAFRVVSSETTSVLINADVAGIFSSGTIYRIYPFFEHADGSFSGAEVIGAGFKVQCKVNVAFGSAETLTVDVFGYLY